MQMKLDALAPASYAHSKYVLFARTATGQGQGPGCMDSLLPDAALKANDEVCKAYLQPQTPAPSKYTDGRPSPCEARIQNHYGAPQPVAAPRGICASAWRTRGADTVSEHAGEVRDCPQVLHW